MSKPNAVRLYPVPGVALYPWPDVEFDATVRIDTPGEASYYRNGGIMQYVLRSLRGAFESAQAAEPSPAVAGRSKTRRSGE